MDASLSALLQHKAHPEHILAERGYAWIAGVDEAGRGPLAGPVVASAVILPQGWFHADVRDSKKLTPKKRAALFPIIKEQAVAWNWALVGPEEIDRINILQATLKAMSGAVVGLSVQPHYIIVDGINRIATPIPQTPIIGGDSKSISIAAASIMAKVIRDSIMKKYHVIYPRYNFARHKGYATREHVQALAAYGCCPIHRKSFRQVISSEPQR